MPTEPEGQPKPEREAAPALIADAGPLIHLDELDSTDLLGDFPIVRIPEEVWEEARKHRPKIFEQPPTTWRRVEIAISQRAEFRALVRSLNLDFGEQAALSLMMEHPDSVFLTDDAAARVAARGMGFRCHGTLGVLLRSVRRGFRERYAMLNLLQRLPEISTLHVRRDLLQRVIEALRQGKFDSF